MLHVVDTNTRFQGASVLMSESACCVTSLVRCVKLSLLSAAFFVLCGRINARAWIAGPGNQCLPTVFSDKPPL